MEQVALVLVVLALASVLGLTYRARSGRFREAAGRAVRVAIAEQALTGADLGIALGERATLVQLSSEVCAACRSTRTVLAGVAAETPGVVHVELDVAERLDLVRRFDVMRTPTTLVLGRDGVLAGRISGGTDRRRALAALAACPGPASRPGAGARPDVAAG